MRPAPPVAVGLALALGGPALLAVGSERLSPFMGPVAQNALGQAVMWGLLAAVVAITLAWERRPLGSLGLRRPGLGSLLFGLVAAAVLIHAVVPLAAALLAVTGLPGFEGGLSRVLALPMWLRVVAVATGGVVEEVLYRGYAITRLEPLVGGVVPAALISVLVFALAHGPLWGPGPVLSFVLSGGFLAAWFVWRRDLVSNIVAHAVVDGMGLLWATGGT